MAIFSRRTLQRIINENSEFLKKKQSKSHVEKLQTGDLTAEWEVVLLNVFSKIGDVIHEPENLPKSNKKIDILFSTKNKNINFLADITCLTGKQADNDILVSFKQELRRIVEFNKLDGFWDVYVGGNSWDADFLNTKPKLKLPTRGEFTSKVFGIQQFQKFIANIKNDPDKNEDFYLRNKEINLSIRYEPRSFHLIHISHFDDNVIVSSSQNSINDSLNRKREQLLETEYKGCLGIILCEAIENAFVRGDSIHYSSKDVINNFLHNHKEINFVLTVTVKEKPNNRFDRKPSVIIDLYEGKTEDTFDEASKDLLTNKLIGHFPKPVRSVYNAKFFVDDAQINNEMFFSEGHVGVRFSHNEIKISARTMLELLAGKLTLEEVFSYWGFNDKYISSIPNQFQLMLNEGKLFSEAKIERCENKDDDWLIFKFSEPDPAISPFKVPETNK